MGHLSFRLDIPANTAVSAPETLRMELDYGLITHIQIVIPSGQKEVAHMRILYRTRQLYPLNPPNWYQGDNSNIEFNDLFPLIDTPYELVAEGYNTSTTYSHAFLIYITVQRPEELGYESIPSVAVRKLLALVGEEVEV